MFTNSLKYTAVICLTFSSMLQMLAMPQITIIDQMIGELSNCSFPPAEVLKQSSQGGLISSCLFTKPSFKDDKPLKNDLNFFFVKYLCMELFDLSLQICTKNIPEEKFPTSEEDFGKLSLSQDVKTFCEKLQFPSSHAKKTSQWAGIAVDVLRNRTLCESQCIKQNNLNPLCGAISWASNLLITRGQKTPPVDKSDSQAITTAVLINQEHEANGVKPEAANPAITKGEPPRTLNSSNVEVKLASSKVSAIGRVQNNDESSKMLNEGGQNGESHLSVVSPTQLVMATPTVASVIAEVSNREMEKEEDHEEDLSIRPSRIGLGDTIGGDDIRLPSEDELGNVVPKGINADIFSQEGDADEDAQTRGNSANGLPYDSKVYHDTFVDAQDSHFFAYFLTMVVICIVGYLVFHNKQKIIALALEGRRMQGSRRRPNTSSYKKLDSNLEEAVTSTCSSSSVSHVIF